MTIREVVSVLDAELCCGEEWLDTQVDSAFCADLMSDVLAFSGRQQLLLSGLVNPQMIRTADLLDMRCIVFVRGKRPTAEMVKLACEKEIVLLSVRKTMYLAGGLLFAAGMKDGGIN